MLEKSLPPTEEPIVIDERALWAIASRAKDLLIERPYVEPKSLIIEALSLYIISQGGRPGFEVRV